MISEQQKKDELKQEILPALMQLTDEMALAVVRYVKLMTAYGDVFEAAIREATLSGDELPPKDKFICPKVNPYFRFNDSSSLSNRSRISTRSESFSVNSNSERAADTRIWPFCALSCMISCSVLTAGTKLR